MTKKYLSRICAVTLALVCSLMFVAPVSHATPSDVSTDAQPKNGAYLQGVPTAVNGNTLGAQTSNSNSVISGQVTDPYVAVRNFSLEIAWYWWLIAAVLGAGLGTMIYRLSRQANDPVETES